MGRKLFLLEDICLRAGVRIHLSLATSHGDVDKSTGVLHSLLGPALGLLGLLLGLNLGSLRFDLSGTSEGSVNFSHG